MRILNKIIHLKILYIFFLILSLNIFFFSTDESEGKAFDINNIDISKPFEINFDKNEVIDEGFKKGFLELISLIINSEDAKKINQIRRELVCPELQGRIKAPRCQILCYITYGTHNQQ